MRSSWLFLVLPACGFVEPTPEVVVPDPTGNATPAPQEDPSVAGALDAHNAVREPLGLDDLTYDPALAEVAAAWIEGLDAQGCILEHDYSSNYGENLYWSSAQASVQDAVAGWESEVAFYDYDTNTCEPGQMCGHYTQLVWADTERVGCALRACAANRGEIVMCVYDPAGNWAGQRPY